MVGNTADVLSGLIVDSASAVIKIPAAGDRALTGNLQDGGLSTA